MNDRERKLYRKVMIRRRDGSDLFAGEHYGCAYFALDLNHDKFAAAALRGYAEACREEYPALAADLIEHAALISDLWALQSEQGREQQPETEPDGPGAGSVVPISTAEQPPNE